MVIDGHELIAEVFGSSGYALEAAFLESLFVGCFADIDVFLAVSEHSVDEDRELASGGKDRDIGAFSASDVSIVGAESGLGSSQGESRHA